MNVNEFEREECNMIIDGDQQKLQKIRDEVERASEHYYHSAQQEGIDNRTKLFVVERCLPFIKGNKVLELGYIDGLWTDCVLQKGFEVEIVEGAKKNIDHACYKYSGNPKVMIHHCLFQEYQPMHLFDTILAADIIRYIEDPVKFLATTKKWLKDDGILIVSVPNSRSLHRRIGSLMGFESTPVALNERDKEVGNLRSYDRYEFRDVILKSGYFIKTLRGCFLKPLSSQQMDSWDDKLLRAFLNIGDELEDYCWFIYAICKKEV